MVSFHAQNTAARAVQLPRFRSHLESKSPLLFLQMSTSSCPSDVSTLADTGTCDRDTNQSDHSCKKAFSLEAGGLVQISAERELQITHSKVPLVRKRTKRLLKKSSKERICASVLQKKSLVVRETKVAHTQKQTTLSSVKIAHSVACSPSAVPVRRSISGSGKISSRRRGTIGTPKIQHVQYAVLKTRFKKPWM